MSAINRLLDEAKEKANIPSDNALAHAMNIERQAINNYRKGRSRPSTYIRYRLAEMTGRRTDEINALIEMETETDPAKQEYWRNFYRTIGGIAASFSIVALLAPITAAIGQAHCILC